MSIYNDMANDAGYSYGTDENELMAAWIEAEIQEELYWEQYWWVVNNTCFGI